ncbi:hypothetical protein C0389_01930 [bacterium]|nr:hypothetical protein [bacterium]
MDEKLKILVVDDDELAQDVFRFYLLKKFEVYTVGSVSSFYNIISKVDFNIILMDISLHDIKDGIELTSELRKNPKYKNIPILMLTIFNSTSTKIHAKEAGADMFINKPVEGRELIRIIESVNTSGISFKATLQSDN